MIYYDLNYIDTSVYLIETDIPLFNDKIKEQLEKVKKSRDDSKKSRFTVRKARNLAHLDKSKSNELKKDAKDVFGSLFSKLKYKFPEDVKELYINGFTISKATKNPETISEFCTHFLQLQEERDENELPALTIEIKNLKEKADTFLISSKDSDLDKKSKVIALNDSDNILQSHFVLLRSMIYTESLTNNEINFRLYFPPVKRKKANAQKNIVEGMSFDIFTDLTKLPENLKTDKIYNEWLLKLNDLFYKEKHDEYICLKKADDFIANKYK